MNYCQKCQKPIQSKKNSYRGLCLSCYQEYLFEKIDYMEKEGYHSDTSSKSIFAIVNDFFKKLFPKK